MLTVKQLFQQTCPIHYGRRCRQDDYAGHYQVEAEDLAAVHRQAEARLETRNSPTITPTREADIIFRAEDGGMLPGRMAFWRIALLAPKV